MRILIPFFRRRLAVLAAMALFAGFAVASEDEPKNPSSDTSSTTKKEGKGDKWDVMKPPGVDRAKTAVIEVTEGTWMNIDVSPDGSTLAFDLLGDLYTLPIAGGEAKAVTSGLAWDMQPRFSPDGKWIAFTSDRGGAATISG